MIDKIIIDEIDVSGCVYALTPKKQCPNKPMPYAKETSCVVCKEKITSYNFCKKNHNCHYKQLKRKEQECEQKNENIKYLSKCLDNSYKMQMDSELWWEKERNKLTQKLKCKEQECEKVKNWIKSKMFYTDCENWFERFVFAFNDWQNDLTKQLDQLKAENETYKKMLDNSEFRVALTDVKTGEREVWRKLGGKAQKYKQALDEIEEFCLVYRENPIEGTAYDKILDIINKAKEN